MLRFRISTEDDEKIVTSTFYDSWEKEDETFTLWFQDPLSKTTKQRRCTILFAHLFQAFEIMDFSKTYFSRAIVNSGVT